VSGGKRCKFILGLLDRVPARGEISVLPLLDTFAMV
jgi:hypothetical protein